MKYLENDNQREDEGILETIDYTVSNKIETSYSMKRQQSALPKQNKATEIFVRFD